MNFWKTPFTIPPERKKKLFVNLTNYVQDFYAGNYKIMMKEIRECLNKWREILCS